MGRPLAYTLAAMTYVQGERGDYRIGDTRVSLDSIVYAFLKGESAESIAQSFPVLSLEQVYGAIAYYLAHRNDVDAYLRASENRYEAVLREARQTDPAFYQKLADARRARAAG